MPAVKTTQKEPRVVLQPVLVSAETAAAMLEISVRQLHRLVAEGRLQKRQLTAQAPRYLRREVEALAEALPVVGAGVA